jgi:ribosomal protein S11
MKGKRGVNPAVRCRVTCTRNNTKVVRTWYDQEKGNRVNRVKTAGARGYPNAKRGTVYAAQEVMADVGKSLRGRESKRTKGQTPSTPGVHVLRRGMGRGRRVVLTELAKAGVKVLTVSDATKDPHNGCRRKKARRV